MKIYTIERLRSRPEFSAIFSKWKISESHSLPKSRARHINKKKKKRYSKNLIKYSRKRVEMCQKLCRVHSKGPSITVSWTLTLSPGAQQLFHSCLLTFAFAFLSLFSSITLFIEKNIIEWPILNAS